jgi:hypothetical protein
VTSPFELKLNSVTMKVHELNIPKHTAFRITFSSKRPPLVVARTKDADRNTFWTSIPEGRQKEAEGIGKLIEEHINKENK